MKKFLNVCICIKLHREKYVKNITLAVNVNIDEKKVMEIYLSVIVLSLPDVYINCDHFFFLLDLFKVSCLVHLAPCFNIPCRGEMVGLNLGRV